MGLAASPHITRCANTEVIGKDAMTYSHHRQLLPASEQQLRAATSSLRVQFTAQPLQDSEQSLKIAAWPADDRDGHLRWHGDKASPAEFPHAHQPEQLYSHKYCCEGSQFPPPHLTFRFHQGKPAPNLLAKYQEMEGTMRVTSEAVSVLPDSEQLRSTGTRSHYKPI